MSPAPVEPEASLTALMARVNAFVQTLSDDEITGLLDGSLHLALVDNPEPVEIRQCPNCAGEGCKVCDDTGVIYP